MPSLRAQLAGPWRAVAVLGVTQIIAWGAIFYPPVFMMPLIAAERGYSFTFTMGGFSLGLLAAGFVAPTVGRMIDEHGGHRIMTLGSLAGAVGLAALVYATHPLVYLVVWVLLGVAMAASLYDAAFATLGRIFGAGARQPITALTLVGGFASTVSWPVTFALNRSLGWEGTYLIYAAVLALVAAPLHAFALPRLRVAARAPAGDAAGAVPPTAPAKGTIFLLVAAAFSAYAFVPSGLSTHLLAIFGRLGIDPATAVVIGTLFGPSQVAARLCEFIFARNVHPLWIVRFAVTMLACAFLMLCVFGISTPTAFAFAIMFGIANGLVTIARGAVPLALFGASGYGRTIGRIAGPALIVTSIAPVVVAFIAERVSDPAALATVAAFGVLSLLCFSLVRRPI
jgi:MFS family permease